MVRAIFFDVDGTLVSMTTHRIPSGTLYALRRLREQGVLLFVCTGRHMSMLRQVREQFDFDGYLTVSGQYCLWGGAAVRSNPIPARGMGEIVEAMEAGGFSGIFLGQGEPYVNRKDEALRRYLAEFRLAEPPAADVRRALREPVYQVIVLLDRAREGLLLDRAEHIRTVRWHPMFLDAMSPDGGKDAGVAAVLRRAGIPPQQAMAFGDGENDIPMLEYVGTGVAMGNAADAVKARADFVAPDVDRDGVRAALERFGLV